MTPLPNAVRLTRNLPAPPGKVYRAWLEPDLVRRWLAPGGFKVKRAEIDERLGGRYLIWHADSSCDVGGFESEIIDLVQDQRIVFRWGFAGPDRNAGPIFDSQLTITLRELPNGTTELTLIHEKLEDLAAALPQVADKVQLGWENVLEKLKVLIAAAPQ